MDVTVACAVCAGALLDGDRFCEQCGARVEQPPSDLGCAAAVTERGRTHDRNEDAYALRQNSDGAVAVVVCDGISTAQSGDLAARAAATAAVGVLAGALADGARGRELAEATRAAGRAARDAVLQIPLSAGSELALPSCTFVSAACRDDEAIIGWIGDSRAYWLAEGDARRLTADDSWATEQVADGLLGAAAAAADHRSHALTRWVGADAPDDEPQVLAFHPEAPGRLILCSDGLWNYAPEARDLAAVLADLERGALPAAVARLLTDTAMARGGRDDITVAVIDIAPERRAAP
jgi:serine/threonine protein phosphatase PrpC